MNKRLNSSLLLLGCIATLVAFTAAGALADGLVIEQTKLGNIFTAGEPVQFNIKPGKNVDKIAWLVKDYCSQEVAKGDAAGEPSQLVLKIDQPGYYTLSIAAYAGGKKVGDKETTLAILPGRDFAAVADSPFGVCTHFGQWWNPEIIPLMASAGVKEIRDEMYWNSLERKKGVFEFPAQAETYMKKLAEAKIWPHMGLTYGNPFYDKGLPPYDDEGRNAFANYAVEVLKHYKGQIRTVEVWNEWNSPGFCQGPAASKPDVYYQLLAATYDRIKQADPDVKVLGCSTTGMWWGGYSWLKRFLNLPGALDKMDAIFYHPYKCELEPEYLFESATKVNEMMKKAGGPVRPAWVTELGWPINVSPGAVADQVYESLDVRTSEEAQALYLVRSHALLLAAGVERIFWYDFMNDGTDSRNGEHNFGLIRHPSDSHGRYTPMPAYVAYATMTRQLTGAKFFRRELTPDDLWCLVFNRDAKDVRVVWSLVPAVLRVKAKAPFVVVDVMGRSRTITPHDGLAEVPVRKGDPVYLIGAVEEVQRGLTVRVDDKCVTCVGEAPRVAYTVENSFPYAIAGELEMAGVAQTFVAKPGATQKNEMTIAPRPATEAKIVPCHVRAFGSMFAELPVKITVDSVVGFPVPPHLRDGTTMRVTLRNSSRTANRTVTRIRWTAGGAKGEYPVSLVIKPLEQAAIDVPDVRLEPYAILPCTVEAVLADGSTASHQCRIGNNPVPRITPKLDGNLDQWEKLPAIDLAKHGKVKMKKYGGPADLSGKVWLGYDDENFYLAARITDDVHTPPVQENGGGDLIDFIVSPYTPWDAAARRVWPGEGFYRFTISLRASGPQVYQWKGVSEDEGQSLATDAVCKARRVGNETIYEAAIPRKGRDMFAADSPYCSISLLVYDRDQADKNGWIEWGSGFAEGKVRMLHNFCRLEKAMP